MAIFSSSFEQLLLPNCGNTPTVTKNLLGLLHHLIKPPNADLFWSMGRGGWCICTPCLQACNAQPTCAVRQALQQVTITPTVKQPNLELNLLY